MKVLYISDIMARIQQGFLDAHRVVTFERMHQMRLVCIAISADSIQDAELRISQDLIPQALVTDKITELFGRDADISVE